jgi:anti-sigma factor RsiW
MSCSPFDLRDYLLNELAEAERRQVDLHVRSCGGCQEEMERLRITQSTLLELRDEEVPQRIGFVSDPVFEPSGPRRFWQALWASGPKLGFASAAMLSAALVIFTFLRPVAAVPAVTAASLDTAKIEQLVSERIAAEMKKVSAESEARREKKTAELLAAAEQRYERQRESDMKNIAFAISILEKKNNVLERASYESGGAR